MKVTKKHLGKIAECTFIDHAMNSPVIECTVWGKVKYVDENQMVIRAWECSSMPDSDSNHENFSIVLSCIKKFKILR